MLAVMAGPFLVPIKGIEVPFDDNDNQTKTFFLGYFPFVLYFTLFEARPLSRA